jgi:hypothetical protein
MSLLCPISKISDDLLYDSHAKGVKHILPPALVPHFGLVNINSDSYKRSQKGDPI